MWFSEPNYVDVLMIAVYASGARLANERFDLALFGIVAVIDMAL